MPISPIPVTAQLLLCLANKEDAPSDPDTSDNDSDQENDNAATDPLLVGWERYNATNTNHYPITYLDDMGEEQTCCYIRYIMENGIPALQGCMHPTIGIYGDILHPRAQPGPVPMGAINDMMLSMFDPRLQQQLIVDTTLAGLNDIGVTAEVT
jgi:hypothetical protein